MALVHEDFNMAFASHLGPWLLGTVKNTTGTTAGLVRNMGATSVGQNATVTWSDAATSTAFWVPAGSLITSVAFYSSTGFTVASGSSTLTVFANSTQIANVTVGTTGAAFAGAVTFTAAGAATLANVGSSDVAIKYTVAGTTLSAGSGTLVVEYLVRNSDGSANPASA
jgi:hypothetical protein